MELRKELEDEEDLLAVAKMLGIELFRVGGSVRDEVAGIEANDFDYVVAGCFNPMATRRAMADIICGCQYGREYPVLRFRMGDRKVEVSFTSSSIVEDLSRRDTTMNAMAVHVETGHLIDPFGGCRDIRRGIVRHVNAASFNPLAAFRAVRQLLQMEQKTGRTFRIARETLQVMNECRANEAPAHRICFEAEDAERMGQLPRFRALLAQAGIILGDFGCVDEDYWTRFADVWIDPIPATSEEELWDNLPLFQPVWG